MSNDEDVEVISLSQECEQQILSSLVEQGIELPIGYSLDTKPKKNQYMNDGVDGLPGPVPRKRLDEQQYVMAEGAELADADALFQEALRGHEAYLTALEAVETEEEINSGVTNVTDTEVDAFLDLTEVKKDGPLIARDEVEVEYPRVILDRVTTTELNFYVSSGLLDPPMTTYIQVPLCVQLDELVFLGHIDLRLKSFLVIKQLYSKRRILIQENPLSAYEMQSDDFNLFLLESID